MQQKKYCFKCSKCPFQTTYDDKSKVQQIVKHMQETAKKEEIGHAFDSKPIVKEE